MARSGKRAPRGQGVTAPGDSAVEKRRKRLEDCRARAREFGGVCLSTEYRGAREKLRWRCGRGHEWEAPPDGIRRGTWCLLCARAAHAIRQAGRKGRNFARVQAIARRRGGACVSTEYVDSLTHLRWRCAAGHEWEARATSIAAGSWCPRCAGLAPLTIDDMRKLARSRGGECLSRSYRSNEQSLRWRCAEGHEWTARVIGVRQGTWCPHCAGKTQKTIAEVQELAAAFGGACLSRSIKTVNDVLRFRCRVGHVFTSRMSRLQTGNWCRRCRQTPLSTFERLESAVQRRGGRLLDHDFRDSESRVRVRCAEGHEWRPIVGDLMQGAWCRECYVASRVGVSSRRLSIADMHEAAAQRGGRCLSDTYVNYTTKLRWQCHDGHEWDAIPGAIRKGSWCPRCARSHRGSIDGMRALAAARGGACHSREYQNHKDVLLFTCSRGHAFSATGMAVKSGAWCPTCGEWDTVEGARARPRRSRGDR